MDPRLLAIAPFVYFGRRYWQVRDRLHLDGPAQHTAYNLWHPFDGTVLLDRESGQQVLRPGQVAISGPGTAVELAAGTTAHHLAFDVVYRPRYSKCHGCVIDVRMPPQPGWQELFGRPLPVALPSGWSQAAIRFIDEVQATYWIDAIAHLKVNAQLFLLLVRLLAWQLQEKPEDETGSQDLVSAAETLIHQRACEGITVAEVAAVLGVSRSTLTQRFIELRGYGPGKALVRRRIEVACYLLENAVERSVEEIARASGFSAGSVLRRVFARELGLSPTRWRRCAQGITAADRDGDGQ